MHYYPATTGHVISKTIGIKTLVIETQFTKFVKVFFTANAFDYSQCPYTWHHTYAFPRLAQLTLGGYTGI